MPQGAGTNWPEVLLSTKQNKNKMSVKKVKMT